MIQFKCPRVIHPLVLSNFGVYSGVRSAHLRGGCILGKVKKICPDNYKNPSSIPQIWCVLFSACRIGLLIRWKFILRKIGFMDYKWSNLNAPGSYTPWCYPLLGSNEGCPFLCMQEKGNAACSLLIKRKFLSKKSFIDSKWSNLNAPGSYTPLCHSLFT